MNYTSLNAWDSISLHDCDITKVEYKAGFMKLYFDDGFWITPNNKYNPHDKTFRTDKDSYLKITDVSETLTTWVKVYTGNDEAAFQERYKDISIQDVFLKINTNEWVLEIITEKHTMNKVSFECYIRLDDPPYNSALVISLEFKNFYYHWNQLLTDRPW